MLHKVDLRWFYLDGRVWMIFWGRHIIYQSFTRGHRDGAVRYVAGAHLSKKSPPARTRVWSFFTVFAKTDAQLDAAANRNAHNSPRATMLIAIEAIKSLSTPRGCAWKHRRFLLFCAPTAGQAGTNLKPKPKRRSSLL
jgi:hypothetical protein